MKNQLKEYELLITDFLENRGIEFAKKEAIVEFVCKLLWGEILAKEHFINQSTKALIELSKSGIELPTENEIEQMAESKSWADGAKWVLERIKFVS